MRRVIAVIVCLAFLGCMLGNRASAQSSTCFYNPNEVSQIPSCWGSFTVQAPQPLPVGTKCYCGLGTGVFSNMCWAPFKGCRPHKPRCQSCPKSGTPAEGGYPIDFATGNVYITQSDVSLPGLGGGLTLTRRWNSIPSSVYASGAHMFGLNWQSTYEDRLVFQTSDGFLTEESGAEDETAFGFNGFSNVMSYSVVAPANKMATITTSMDSNFNPLNWTLVSMDGEKRIYNPAGALLSITDRNGNITQLTYDASNRLVTVTDPASRHLNFTYQSASSNLVSTVSSDVGISLSYTYDSNGRLIKVTKPDNTNISFTYDGQNRITAVLDNDGKTLESHTYDANGRGLTSSRVNGVDSLTVTYPQ
jgi:YD repeat-containing protein